MENNDGLYYIKAIKSIAETISFVTFICERFDRRHGIHPDFVDEHIRVLNGMKSDVETLYHLLQRELGRKTRRIWLESVKYRDHYPIDLN